jgi:hypothetical protein
LNYNNIIKNNIIPHKLKYYNKQFKKRKKQNNFQNKIHIYSNKSEKKNQKKENSMKFLKIYELISI